MRRVALGVQAQMIRCGRVLKNKHLTVSQGVRRFGKRSLFSDR
jgi:hypothetical protein